MIRNLIIVFCAGVLTACDSGVETTNLQAATDAIRSVLNPPEVSQLTATRTSLEQSGFDQPLLVGTLTQPIYVTAGLLLASRQQGIEYWRGGDGSLVKTDNGILRGTVGVPFDLYGADTAPTVAAFRGGRTNGYTRVYRHLNALNHLDVTRYFCDLSRPVPETIVVFDKEHRTLRFSESCIADAPNPTGIIQEFENTYWKDANRLFMWKSEQWISDKIGTILLERVFE